MYKLRFTQWRVRKNISFRHTVAEMERVRTSGSRSAAHRGPVNEKRLLSYISRLPEQKRTQLLEIRSKPLTNPLGSVLVPPTQVYLPEKCIDLLRTHVKGSFENGSWLFDSSLGFKEVDVVPAWCSSVMCAAQVLDEGKEIEARRLLNTFIRQSPRQLSRQDPFIFAFIYTSVLFFARKRPDIAQELLYVLHCVSEKLPWAGSSHPLRLLLGTLYHLGPEGITSYASKILLAYVKIIHETLGAAYPIVQNMLSDTMDRLLAYNLLSAESVADLGQQMVLAAESQGRHRCKDYFNLKLQLSNSYLQLGEFRAARDTAMEITEQCHNGVRDNRILVGVHILLSKINEADDRQIEANLSALRAVTTSREIFGDISDWVLKTLTLRQQFLERVGEIDEARKVIEDRDVVLSRLCRQMERLEDH